MTLGALTLPLVDPTPADSQVGPGLIGFLMFLFLAAATVLLWLSFRRQLKKVRFDVEPLPPRRSDARLAADPSAGSAAGSSAGRPPTEGDPSES